MFQKYFRSLAVLFAVIFHGPVLAAPEMLLNCVDKSSMPRATRYEVWRAGDQLSIIKKKGEEIEVTHELFAGGDASAISGYGGTYLYLHNLGRSGFLMIYFHRGGMGESEGKTTSLIDINLFPPEARKLNTEGPQTHFNCDTAEQATTRCEDTRGILTDVTKEMTYRGSVISAFPEIYAKIPKEENADIIKSFKISRHSSCPAFERRIEVFYTGGDWMTHGLTYFVTDAPNKSQPVPDEKAAAYFMSDLSTTDREMGEVPPKINPLDDKALREFVTKTFLDAEGRVNSGFVPLQANGSVK